MENYQKGKNVEEQWNLKNVPIDNLPEDITWMQVSAGAKIRNLLDYALKDFKDKDTILWSGAGPAIGKTISCAEIMKNKFKSLHQISKVCYKKVEEYWDPLIDTLDQLKVTREIPVIHILLSKQPLDTTLSGYQAPGNKNVFWKNNSTEKNTRRTPHYKHGNSSYQRRNYGDELGLMKNKKNKQPREPREPKSQTTQ